MWRTNGTNAIGMDIRSQLKGLNTDLCDISDETDNLVQSFHRLADKLDSYSKHGRKARLAGTVVAISGGVLCAVGVGLTFVTIGLSVGITVIGGVLVGAGGATSSVQEKSNVTTTHIKRDVSSVVERYNSKWGRIKDKAILAGRQLEKKGDIDYQFSRWCEFWSKLLPKGKNRNQGKTWNSVVHTLQSYDEVDSSEQPGSSYFQPNGGSEIKPFGIGDTVDGVDSYLLLDSNEVVDKKMLKKVSKSLRQMASSLESKCPRKSEITNMVEETLERL